jgi:hypothetical protein
MKATAILICCILVMGTSVWAKKIKGTIIAKGQSREVMFNVKIPFLGNEPSFERIQYRIKYYDESGKKHVLLPHEADEIQFDYDGMKVRMISCPNSLGFGNIFSSSPIIFLKLEIEGPLKLYRYYYRQTSGGMMTAGGGFTPSHSYTVENFIFQKGNGPLKRPRALGWKKDMLDYFSDCPALAKLIESKDLRRKEIEAIVMFYNGNCTSR